MHAYTGTPIHTKNVSITVRVSRFPVIFSEPPICHLYFNLTFLIILVTHTDLYKLHFQIYIVQCITVDDMCWSSPQKLKQQLKNKETAKEKGEGEMSRMSGKNKSWKSWYIYISKTSCNHTFLSIAIHVTPNIQLLKASQSKRTLCNIPNKGKQKPKQGQQRKNWLVPWSSFSLTLKFLYRSKWLQPPWTGK